MTRLSLSMLMMGWGIAPGNTYAPFPCLQTWHDDDVEVLASPRDVLASAISSIFQ